MPDRSKDIGARIRRLREERDLTQDQLAERCGVYGANVVSRWESPFGELRRAALKNAACGSYPPKARDEAFKDETGLWGLVCVRVPVE